MSHYKGKYYGPFKDQNGNIVNFDNRGFVITYDNRGN